MHLSESRLFLGLSKYVKSIPNNVLLEELLKAEKAYPFGSMGWHTDRNIGNAFEWSESPQGQVFWDNLHDEWIDEGGDDDD